MTVSHKDALKHLESQFKNFNDLVEEQYRVYGKLKDAAYAMGYAITHAQSAGDDVVQQLHATITKLHDRVGAQNHVLTVVESIASDLESAVFMLKGIAQGTYKDAGASLQLARESEAAALVQAFSLGIELAPSGLIDADLGRLYKAEEHGRKAAVEYLLNPKDGTDES